MNKPVSGLVEHLFRREAGRMLSSLGRQLGSRHLDLAEECVQDAMVQALKTWPYQGQPENPAAWLARTAHNFAIDRLRRQETYARIQSELASRVQFSAEPADVEAGIDDQLAMMFACCHPKLTPDARIALTLKAVCGFGTDEIARAFLADETAIAQRIVRAKRFLRDTDVPIVVPPIAEQAERLDSVLHVLYLLFNEGYAAHSGQDLVRHDLCEEALRLGRLLAHSPSTCQPRVHALVALMFFHASRLPARVDGAGDLLRLIDQDREQWDQRLVHAGLRHLDLAAEGDELTAYHLEAGIAAIHAQATSDDATDWERILWLFDRLGELSPTPIVKLNRAVALMRVRGPEDALAELATLDAKLANYYLLHSVRGDFLRRAGRLAEATQAYRMAMSCPCCEPEKRFLKKRLDELRIGNSDR